jgi:hypothetical protein
VSHLRAPDGTVVCDHADELHDFVEYARDDHERDHDDEHGHSHGLVDRSILRSRAGVKAVATSLAILGVAAGAQLAIFVSACVALYETVLRFIHPQHLTHLWVLAAAGIVGFVGNELAAQVRLSAGRRLASAAMVADGNHARIDGFVSLGVVASAIVVSLGAQIGDPIIGLAITLAILKITWDSWNTVRLAEIDLEHIDDDHEHG